MTDENTLAEATPIECPAPKKRPQPERTIFRFKGAEDVSIDLGKIYKIVCKDKEKKVLLQMSPKLEDLSDSVEFESEEAAYRGYEQIIGAWAGNVLE